MSMPVPQTPQTHRVMTDPRLAWSLKLVAAIRLTAVVS
jgi:hypothetical protein